MAYVIFTANGDEVDRRELAVAVTIGRAQDADIPVRDILLSRKHCRIEPSGEQWVVTDLGSKNGTYLGYRQIMRHQLRDGDELRIGRTRVTFKAGAFAPAPVGTKRRDVVRPADPTEALAGTVAGFLLVEPGEVERQAGAPVPQPRPPEPTSFASEDVYGMLNEIASSSWDSIMAQASRPIVMERPLPRPSGFREAPPVARRTRVAFSLQAPMGETTGTGVSTETDTPGASKTTNPLKAQCTARPPQATRWWNVPAKAQRQIALGVVSVVATVVLVGAWVVAVNRGPRASDAGTVSNPRGPQPGASPDLVDITLPPLPAPAPAPAPAVAPAPIAEQPGASPLPLNVSAPRHATLKTVARVAAVHFLVVR
jgi:hypothetical protein